MGQIDAFSGFSIHPLVSDSSNNANYLIPGLVVFGWSKADPPSNRTCIGPILSCQALVDDCHLLRVFGVSVVKVSASQHGNAHRAKVIGSHDCMLDDWCLAHR